FFKSQNTGGFFFHPLRWLVDNFIHIEQLTIHAPGSSIIDRIFFVLFIPLLIGIYWHLPKVYTVYALAVGLLPALFGNVMSFPRYLIIIFPFYILLALRYHKHYLWLALPMSVVQIILLSIHSLAFWIA
ncbi:MAG TPA: hypothetical protein VJB65_04905, partial [Patescibacteria group bacterium]|nr:hypothetical protein [Patescibacteria group bacterium]